MDKYSFDIFVKEKKKFKFITILINLVILLVMSGISYVLIANEFLENSLTWIVYIIIMATAVAYFNKMFQKEKYEPKGITSGEVTFYKDKIFIGDKMIPIDQVKMINIKNDDFVGNEVRDFGEFKREEKSFGVNNFITVQNQMNTFFETQFKQKTRKEFENMREILLEYYKNGLFDYEDLVYIMKIEYDLEKSELKKDLEKINNK